MSQSDASQLSDPQREIPATAYEYEEGEEATDPYEESEEAAEVELREEAADAVKQYLRSIGRYRLLTAAQEVELGLAAETWIALRDLRQEYRGKYGRQPKPPELAALIYERLVALRRYCNALAHSLNVSPDEPYARLLFLPVMRESLDRPMAAEVRKAVAERLGESEDVAASHLTALARLSRLLPPHIIETLEQQGVVEPDARCRKVRSASRPQVQHLRNLVDPPGDHKSTC